MKANEFVKNNPWLLEDNLKEIKKIISDAKDYKYFCLNNALGHSYDNHGGGVSISIDDLKRLVESHELVKSYGGLELAKKELQRQSILRWINPETERLRGAIADVESCLEADKKLEGL